jgi:hypothetical protein
MQKLFGFDKGADEGVVTVPDWNYLKAGFQASLDIVTAYYRTYSGRVDASHFLIKLIYGVGVPRALPLDRFYAMASAKALGVAMANRMTSPISKGQLFDGVFYGKGVREVLIGHDDDFDFQDAARNWQALQPIKVLSHPKSDLGLNIPDGTGDGLEEGVAVISINIPMLALQYRQWAAQEWQKAVDEGDSPKGITHFIYSYPLTNMLYSHLDVTIFNRLYNLLNNIPLASINKRHSFFLTDYDNKLNVVQKKQLDILRAGQRSFEGMLRTIPMVSVDNLSQLAALPDVAPTRQVIWALALARLEMLSFLFKVTEQSPRTRSSAEVNRIVRNFQLYRTDKALQSSLPYNLYFDARRDINAIVAA